MSRRSVPFPLQLAIAFAVGSLGWLAIAGGHVPLLPAAETLLSSDGHITCPIKGNISEETGERIYHVPGQKYYDATIIDPARGERWFCTEAEARAAGWRRSRI